MDFGSLVMSRDSDLTLYMEFNNVNKFTYNVKSLSRDIETAIIISKFTQN